MALQINSICQRFKKQDVLHNVSLNIEEGDCYGLLGHNGAGKTTILRTITGLMKPKSGSVYIDNFDVHAFPREAHARMGGLIESPCFNENWNGFKNLCVFARLQGFNSKEAEKEATRVLKLVGYEKDSKILAHKKVREYSFGMKQRLGIAQALLGNPSYILLDEPMNGLDPQAIAEVRSLIKRLTEKENITVVISSHNLAEISNLCNKIAILRDGTLLIEESTNHLIGDGQKLYRLQIEAEQSIANKFFEDNNITYQLEKGNESNNAPTFIVDLKDMKPAELSRLLLDNKIELLSLTPFHPSLEDVYLRINSMSNEGNISSSSSDKVSALPSKGKPEIFKAPRRAFLRGMNYELTRISSGLKIALLFLLPAIFACISIWIMYNQSAADAAKVGEEIFSTTQMTAFDGVGKGLKTGLPILMLLITCLASQSVSGEQSTGTLRYLFMRPITRLQISLSKLSSIMLICIVSYIVLTLSIVCISSHFFDFKDLSELLSGKLIPMREKEEMYHYLWPTLLSPILPLLCYAAIGFTIGSWIKSNIAAFATTLGAIAFIDIGRAIVPGGDNVIGWLPSAHLPSPFGGHSFLTFYCNFVQGISNATNPYSDFSIKAPLVWLVIMIILAIIALKRKAG